MAEDRGKRRAVVNPAVPGSVLATRADQTGLARGFDDIFNEFRRSFDDLMRPLFPLSIDLDLPAVPSILQARTDLVDNGDSYTVTVELPGFQKDQIDVQINKDGMAIRAEYKEEKEEKKNYLHRERAYSSLQRMIAFPEEVVPSKAEGSMKDGLLEVKVPKKEPKPEEKPHKVELK